MHYMYAINMNAEPTETIALTSGIIAELNAERDRTSIGPQALLKPYKDKP